MSFWVKVVLYFVLLFGFTFIYFTDPVIRSQTTFVYQDF